MAEDIRGWTGSKRRKYNIELTAKWLCEGISEEEIEGRLGLHFCPDTVSNYLAVAKLFNKSNNSGKSVKEEKPQIQQKIEKEQDFTLDLNDFIKSNHYEKLSDSELIEKINTLKNEKLKINWIKQIKEGYKND